jgi:nitroreductase
VGWPRCRLRQVQADGLRTVVIPLVQVWLAVAGLGLGNSWIVGITYFPAENVKKWGHGLNDYALIRTEIPCPH